MLPIHSLIAEHRELGLVIAVVIGFGFGFVLERAGFGRSTKLAAQFYLHDMTVFKVMFSAIITAMAGMVIADGVGLVDLRALSESVVSYTYIGPMIVGGLVLGAGFIISGYCPGTSVVGIASGNVDALFTFGGVIIGSVIYGEIFPLIASFHNSGDKGFLFLYDVVGIPAPILAAIIVAVAVMMFFGAERVERIFRARRGETPELPVETRRPRALALGTIGGLAVLAFGTLALPTEPAAGNRRTMRQSETIGQAELARRLLNEPWTMRILDLRNETDCGKARIPGAECAPLQKVADLQLKYTSGARDLVLVNWQTGKAPQTALEFPGRVLLLNGGWLGWRNYALTKPALPSSESTAAEREEYLFRAALHSAMTGRKPAAPPPATGAPVPQKKKKKGGGCS